MGGENAARNRLVLLLSVYLKVRDTFAGKSVTPVAAPVTI